MFRFRPLPGAALAAFCAATLASTFAARPDLDQAAKTWLTDRPGGVSIAYIDAEGVTFGSAGTFAPGDARAITPETTFEIGSITKVFTALLTEEAERAGKLSRHDSAAKYLLPADDPDQAKLAPVTLLALATQHSGLPSMPGTFRPGPGGTRAGYMRDQMIASFRVDGARAQPGKVYFYSNYGINILGHSAAAAWGEPYPVALQTHVLTPLGLEHTWLGITGTKGPADFPPGLVKGEVVLRWEADALVASGGLRSTARDLAKFAQACLGLRPTPLYTSILECQLPITQGNSPQSTIGLCWQITTIPGGTPLVWHNGATNGFNSFLGLFPGRKIGVVVFTNTGVPVDPLGKQLLGITPPPAQP